jgi:hypothetical protein
MKWSPLPLIVVKPSCSSHLLPCGQNHALQSELDAAHREISRLQRSYDEGNDWDWQDKPEEIAASMLLSHPTKAKSVAAAILAQSKSTAPKPRKKRRTDPDTKLARYLYPTKKPRA